MSEKLKQIALSKSNGHKYLERLEIEFSEIENNFKNPKTL